MGERRWWSAVVAVITASAALAGCGAEAPQAPAGPLRILVVNDDGFAAPGIAAVRDALRAAGHTVVEVAPMTDSSDSGTAITTHGEVPFSRPSGRTDEWAVRGTAADAAMTGIFGAMGSAQPELVISGIDDRLNVGSSLIRSGTVGAAMSAAAISYPAVALSAGRTDLSPPRPGDFVPVADFTVRLVDRLSRRPAGAPILPPKTVLNVNYPVGGAPPGEVVSATTSDVPFSWVGYRPGPRPGTLAPVEIPYPPAGQADDVDAVLAGNVTLSDLSADPDRSAPPPRTAARLAPTMRP